MDARQFAFLARLPSATVQPRGSFCGIPNRALAFLLANVMFWQPLWAQADGIVVSAAGTGLAQAGNGVPIVNIAAPNTNGLSHNQFKDYNVGAQGVILNNATERTQNTQLGGIILGNPNFNGRAADIILNEVNGGSPSQLRGYTEVAGKSAHVIVANPHGISCDGCGFINTPKATLSTGKPVIENGQLSRYQVDQGTVAIQGAGLNASNVDQFEIISRATQINAQIQANKLDIIAGRNDVDARTLAATARAADGSQVPELAIDSSALGGMYVNTIRLVGTEAGVGVKLAGDMIAGGDIQIDANGKLSLGQVSAGSTLNVKAQSLDVQGTVYTGKDLAIATQGDLRNQGSLAAGDSIRLDSAGRLLNLGIVEAGINADNSRNSHGDLRVTAQSIDNSARTLVASRDLNVSTTELANQGGTLSAGRNAQVDAIRLDNQNRGRILSGGNLGVNSQSLLNGQGGLLGSKGSLGVSSTSLINRNGELSGLGQVTLRVATLDNVAGLVAAGQSIDLYATGLLDNRNGGQINSKQQLTASVGSLDQQGGGRLHSDGGLSLDLRHGQLDNRSGVINASGQLILENLDNVDNRQGEISSDRSFSVAASSLDNRFGKLTSNVDLTTTFAGNLLNQSGQFSAGGNLQLSSAGLVNDSGRVSGAGSLSLTARQGVSNLGGEILGSGALTLSSLSLDNSRGRIAADGMMSVTTGAFSNQAGSLTSVDRLDLNAGQVDNLGGRIASGKALTATLTGLDQRGGGELYSNSALTLDLSNGLLNNSGGLINAPGPLLLRNLSTVINRGGEISSEQGFRLAAESLDNSGGDLLSDQAIGLNIRQALLNAGGQVAATGLTAEAASLDNRNGLFSSSANLNLTIAGALLNEAGEVSGAGTSVVNAASLGNSNGQVMSDIALDLSVSGALSNQGGTLGAGRELKINAGSLDNSRNGSLVSDGSLGVTVSGLLDNQSGGSVLAKGTMELLVDSLDNRSGRLSGQNTLTLRGTSLDNRDGVIRANQDMLLRLALLDNRDGLLNGVRALELGTRELRNQGGLVSASGVVRLNADTVSNGKGRIASQSDLLATVDTFEQLGGELVAQGALSLTGNQLDNRSGGLVGSTKALKIDVQSVDNRGGEISSQQNVSVSAAQLDNSGGKLMAGTTLDMTVARVINQTRGLLFAQDISLAGGHLDNAQGTIAGQRSLLVRLTAQPTAQLDGNLDNGQGSLSSEGTLSLSGQQLDNRAGSISSAGLLQLNGAAGLLNQGGTVESAQTLNLTSASLDNSGQGLIKSQGSATLTTGRLDNNLGGRVISSADLNLSAGQVSNGGRIASNGVLDARFAGLVQDNGELFSNSQLTLDLNQGDLSNRGLINAPNLILKNLGAVTNQGGEISSQNAFSLAARSFDNGNGKLVSNQVLTLRIEQLLGNIKGQISAAGLDLGSQRLDNSDGLISSRGVLTLNASESLLNQKGTLIADGVLKLNSASLDNRQGEIAGKALVELDAQAIDNQNGQLIGTDRVTVRTTSLDNRGGLLGATKALKLDIGAIDNRSGELTSNGDVTITGQNLDNSDDGVVFAAGNLTLAVQRVLNRARGQLSGQGVGLTGASLDNSGGLINAQLPLVLNFSGELNNRQGSLSSESTLDVTAGSLDNSNGSLGSASGLTLTLSDALDNGNGELVSDGSLLLRSARLHNDQGSISAKGAVSLVTGTLSNSGGRLNSAQTLDLTASQVSNGGSIGSLKALTASVGGLDQQGGKLFSNTRLSLDLNGGRLDNQGGLINSAGPLLLSNLAEISNRSGEISSAQAFTLNARSLDNDNGRVLGSQGLNLVIAQALSNIKGLIGAASLGVSAGVVDNREGILNSRSGLQLSSSGLLDNRQQGLISSAGALTLNSGDLYNQGGSLLGASGVTLTTRALNNSAGGLINSQGGLGVTASSLDSSNGEVSARNDLSLDVGALSVNSGRIIGDQGVTLDLHGNDLDNRSGLILAKGGLNLQRIGTFNNVGGELSAQQDLILSANRLDNSDGKLIGVRRLLLETGSVNNQRGLLSGWQGLVLNGGSLDNRNLGTLSSRSGALDVQLSGALLNNNDGALVSQGRMDIGAASLDNSGGVLSSGAALQLNAATLGNQGGSIDAQQLLTVNGTDLDNSGGRIAGNGSLFLDLRGTLTNTDGTLISADTLLLRQALQVANHGGKIVSRGRLELNAGSLDNSQLGTLAARDQVKVNASSILRNSAQGLIYSERADVRLLAAGLLNQQGEVQGQSGVLLDVAGALDNRNGKLLAQGGNLVVQRAGSLGNQGGILASIAGLLDVNVSGVLDNSRDLGGKGGVVQGQQLLLVAGSVDNSGGRVAAQSSDARIRGGDFINAGGGLYAKGLLRVDGLGLDNNAGQVAGSRVELALGDELVNRSGVIESDSQLLVSAGAVDNQSGQLRALGTADKSDFQIRGGFDNRYGRVEVGNSDLTLNTTSLSNFNGSVLHGGTGTFDISTANITNSGGNLVTRGGLTLTADSWINSSVIQAGRLTVNVGELTQTSSGQLLASESFTGSGNNWTMGGLIASDGRFDLTLASSLNTSGRASSLGGMNVTLGQLNLGATASLSAGDMATVNVGGLLSNAGRLTSASNLTINAGGISNYGSLGSGQVLTATTTNLLNQNGFIFSGADMALYAQSLSNREGDIYGLGAIRVARDAQGTRAALLENISGTIESLGDFSIAATTINNKRVDFDLTPTLQSGYIGVRCYSCSRHTDGSMGGSGRVTPASHLVWAQTYTYDAVGQVAKQSSLVSGHNLSIASDAFVNSNSTVSAAGNIDIKTGSFSNTGTSLNGYSDLKYIDIGTPEGPLWQSIFKYNAENDPGYNGGIRFWNAAGAESMAAITSGSRPIGKGESRAWLNFASMSINILANGGGGGADYRASDFKYPANYLSGQAGNAPPEVQGANPFLNKRIENAGSNYLPSVVEAGGTVSITAASSISNGVERSYSPGAAGSARGVDTRATGTGTNPVIVLNKQLPPNLAQQQINPLSLPGFSLPTNPNGLFRLSDKVASAGEVATGDTASRNWTLGGASVDLAQRQQAVPGATARTIQMDDTAQLWANTGQVSVATREAIAIDANASSINVSALGNVNNGTWQSGRSNAGEVTRYDGIGSQAPSGGSAGSVGGQTPPVREEPVAEAALQLARVTTALQTIERVQGLPDRSAASQTHKYLIETSPLLTDLKQFMSSDYLLAGLGYNPDDSAKRLGDGFYEQRLIQQAVVAATGQRFLAGQTSDEKLFKYLMDNAIASKQQLNLAVGVGLSAEQVAALTHDIVWLEEAMVNGEKVLVPVLYLANANNRLAPNGALVAGTDINLIAGEDLLNAGTLRASNNLSASAGNDIVNSGLIQAGNRVDLLAGNDIVNKAGGIISGRDVSLTTVLGDVINERSVTSHVTDSARLRERTDYVDSAARIEAANDLSVNAGRDFLNVGGVLQSGRDTTLQAARDIVLGSAEATDSAAYGRTKTQSVTQNGSSVTAGRDFTAVAGRDLTSIASQIDAQRDIDILARGDVTLISAADEQHSSYTSKKLKTKEDHVSQVATLLKAGGDVAISAGEDLALSASRVTAGDEAYLVAGGKLALLAAEDSDYSLYQKKSKGSFGAKKTQRDEVTDVKHIGSEITSAGDLTLVSGEDQHYQVAKLSSGGDLLLDSGGNITFEGVKDLHQESHEKSKGDLAWNSAKGEGRTDETLRQSQLLAKGDLLIKAADGMNIDIRHIDRQSVAQTIDAMIEVDPQLSWLKEAEARGDVDWRMVKEIHDRWDYKSAGLGAAPALIISIVASVYLGPLAGAITSNFAIGTVNGGGDLGAGFSAATSSDALKGYATQMATGYALGVIDSYVSGWQTEGGLILNSNGVNNPGYSSGMLDWNTVTDNVLRSSTHALISGSINTAINGGSWKDNLGYAVISEGLDLTAAFANKQVGDLAAQLKVDPGSASKILMHALLGGALSVAKGEDFNTGALAGAAAEGLTQSTADALGKYLDARFVTDDQFRIATAQVIGVLAGAMGNGDPEIASWVAGNAERYNQQVHRDAATRLEKGFATLHEQGLFADLQPQDVLMDLQKIADGEKDPSNLNPRTVEFLNQFSPADLREIFFEPTQAEQIAGLGIDLFFPSASGKGNAATAISGPVAKEILESLEKKFGGALAESAAKSAGGAKGAGGALDDLASSKVKWVDENAGMSSRARDYNDSATGARSNPATQSGQAPALERTMPDGSTRLVKFDGVDGDVLVDRKISVVTTSKSKDQALRQSDVLSQNGLTARWEVPTQAQATRAQKMFDELGIKNISVKVIHEPGNQ